ncbi:hypothetical protein [Pseudomonas fluorescens]|uniref:hypothetical protein n=1 Tax=Pseudomonas fluorescens TaxID=294 RepID=UPI0039902E23
MSTDSSFQNQTQGSVPSKPEPSSDEPTLDPDDPNKYDPLKNPSDDRPEDWKDPGERTTPEAMNRHRFQTIGDRRESPAVEPGFSSPFVHCAALVTLCRFS